MMLPYLQTAIAGGLLLAATSLLDAQAPGDAARAGDDLLFAAVPTVSAASRYVQDIAEAPASISVITREEIRRMGYRSLADILTSARGIYASSDRNYTYLGLRGFAQTGNYNSRVLLLIDGHRLNEPVNDYVGLGLDIPIGVEDIERVEIVRGPGSSLYGTNAILGVINIVTRRPTGQGTTVQGEGGSLGTWRGRASWDGTMGQARVLLSGTYFSTDGSDFFYPAFVAPPSADGWVRGMDGEQGGNALGKAYVGPVQVVAGFGQREKDIPTASFETTPNVRSFTMDRRAFSFARYEHTYANLSRLTLRAAFDTYRYEGTYPYDETLFTDFQTSSWWTLEGQYVRSIGRHRLIGGTEVRFNTDLTQGGDWEGDTWLDERTSRVAAVFLQDEIRLGRVLLNVGLRHDQYSTVGGTTNPRAALIVPVGRGTTVKLLAGRAFRAPNGLELYYYAEDNAKAAGQLDPEFLTSYEMVIDRAIGSTARFTGSVYRLSITDGLILVTDPEDGELVYSNAGRATGHGAEVELEGRIGPVDARASYAYQRVHQYGWDGDPPNAPRHLVRMGGSLPLNRYVTVGAETRGVSRRLGMDGAGVSGYWLTSARLIVSPWRDRIDIMLSGSNLLGQAIADPGGEEHRQVAIPQDGRTFRFGFRARL